MQTWTRIAVGIAFGLFVGLAVHPVVAEDDSGALVSASAHLAADAESTTVPEDLGAPGDEELPVVVGLGDSLVYHPGSWFRRVCASARIGQCVDAGVRGDTVNAMAARLRTDVLDEEPAALVLMAGTNDVTHRALPRQVVDRIDRIVVAARGAGVTVVLCTIPPRDAQPGRTLAVNRGIRAYAEAEDVPLLDLYDTVGTPEGSWKDGASTDGVHPSAAGAAAMAAAAERELPALLGTALTR